MATFSILIHGWAVGQLWYGGEGYKSFGVDVLSQRRRIITGDFSRPTLRDVIELATTEEGGDFCGGMSIAGGVMVVQREEFDGDRRRMVERRYDLAQFPSIADYLHPDPDWMPMSYDDLEEAA